ncbi:hypothetical protein LK07_31035 [Streptomyces pluripotens]|uniref:Metallo-beta-lactamase domain-containing protein n=1 Tax=Streptomyces pluripotens TaxID=1355015 RepID=A0A221P611_9ACTN|nr:MULTISPECIES: hypothetical protein [Streptomyces]ARP73482.1 hypothetical protein LK06_029840 [Streptomyces pluripotens]ASN27733.1 hypothetical protein LK07_31035 [Streptomyces pluripotens]MCH0557360.1 hypothetical protein [Streptomyces sp. MUM 16J]
MHVIDLLPHLHLLCFPVGQAYLWRSDHELTLTDAGPMGSGRKICDAASALGHVPGDVRQIVSTHFRAEHAGRAGEFAALSGADVLGSAWTRRSSVGNHAAHPGGSRSGSCRSTRRRPGNCPGERRCRRLRSPVCRRATISVCDAVFRGPADLPDHPQVMPSAESDSHAGG